MTNPLVQINQTPPIPPRHSLATAVASVANEKRPSVANEKRPSRSSASIDPWALPLEHWDVNPVYAQPNKQNMNPFLRTPGSPFLDKSTTPTAFDGGFQADPPRSHFIPKGHYL